MTEIKIDTVYAWMFEQLGKGTLSEEDVLETYGCSNVAEWLTKIKDYAIMTDDMTPIEILTGLTPDALHAT